MSTQADLRKSVDQICAWFEREPHDFADGGREAVLRLLGEIEPQIRARNLCSDFELTEGIVKAMKRGSLPRQHTLDRAHRAIYGLKISLG